MALSVISNRACASGLILADLPAGSLARRRRNLRRLLRNESFFLQPLDQAVDHFPQFLILGEVRILQELFHQFGRNRSPSSSARKIASRSSSIIRSVDICGSIS